MRGDENRNIDVPSKVKAFRKDFPPDKAAIHTSYRVLEIAGAPAVEGRALVVLLGHENEPYNLLSEAYATRGLRAPKPGAQGMQDTRDAERAMTGAVGRALFLMGYGEKADDSADYEAEDPEQWAKDRGWRDQAHHDALMADAKEALRDLPTDRPKDKSYRTQAVNEWDRRGLHWPLTYEQMESWITYLVPLARKAKEEAKAGPGASDAAGGELAPAQPPLEDALGPDAPLVKR